MALHIIRPRMQRGNPWAARYQGVDQTHHLLRICHFLYIGRLSSGWDAAHETSPSSRDQGTQGEDISQGGPRAGGGRRRGAEKGKTWQRGGKCQRGHAGRYRQHNLEGHPAGTRQQTANHTSQGNRRWDQSRSHHLLITIGLRWSSRGQWIRAEAINRQEKKHAYEEIKGIRDARKPYKSEVAESGGEWSRCGE